MLAAKLLRRDGSSYARRLLPVLVILLSVGWSAPALAYEKIRVSYEFHIEGTGGAGAMPFEQPTDLEIINNRLYVLDGMNHRVAVFGLDGSYRHQFGNRRDLPRAIGLCAAADDGIYVADAETGRLHHYAPGGEIRRSLVVTPVAEGEKPDITDCAVSSYDEIFLVDNNNHRIQVYDLKGERIRHWGGFGEASHQFRYPATVTIDSTGVVFVVDVINNMVKGFRSSGRPAQWVGGWGITPGRLFRPKGALVVGDRIFVSDSYTGVIQVFRTSGGLVGILADENGDQVRFRTPINMAFADNRLYVVEQLANRVSVWRLVP